MKAKNKQKNKIHPVAIKLTQLFVEAIGNNLLNTAWCLELAQHALGWELAVSGESEAVRDMFVMNKLKSKIEKDKGVSIR